ncbi:hypothetical protein K470DRAFT_255859 [Piedraia hortae CBS 480.64]|uniref:Uncharacterized protein n=1 Tax=Piedraia hortae CBS 480.64 TaxID=1314780 RepID=A0A6A7C5P2_9PEZI|nr:hypothetical protein K470DRAFT_255859 [Piedraia hortae CBS 480.64]
MGRVGFELDRRCLRRRNFDGRRNGWRGRLVRQKRGLRRVGRLKPAKRESKPEGKTPPAKDSPGRRNPPAAKPSSASGPNEKKPSSANGEKKPFVANKPKSSNESKHAKQPSTKS